jgi:hypothetical protein
VLATCDVVITGAHGCTLSSGSGGASQTRWLITRIAVGWRPPDGCPSGAGLHLGTRGPAGLATPSRGTPDRGRASSACVLSWEARFRAHQDSVCMGSGDRLGHGPHEACQCPGHGHDHLVGGCAAGQQASTACAPPPVRLPPAVLARLGERFPPALPVAPDVGGIPVGPGAFDQDAAGLGVAGCGERTLPAALTTGVCRGDQAQRVQPWSGLRDARPVAACGHDGASDGARHPPSALQGLDHGLPSPGFALLLPCVRQTREACGVLVDRADGFLADARWRRGGTDHGGEPAPMGRAPRGPARRAELVPAHTGIEPARGGLESPPGLVMGAGASPPRVICHRGAIDAGESPRAPQPRPWHGVTTVGVHPVAGLVGHEGGRDAPTALAVLRQRARAPGPTGARGSDADQGRGLGVPRAHAWSKVAWPRATGASVEDRSVVRVGDRGHGAGVLVDIQPPRACASVRHG